MRARLQRSWPEGEIDGIGNPSGADSYGIGIDSEGFRRGKGVEVSGLPCLRHPASLRCRWYRCADGVGSRRQSGKGVTEQPFCDADGHRQERRVVLVATGLYGERLSICPAAAGKGSRLLGLRFHGRRRLNVSGCWAGCETEHERCGADGDLRPVCHRYGFRRPVEAHVPVPVVDGINEIGPFGQILEPEGSVRARLNQIVGFGSAVRRICQQQGFGSRRQIVAVHLAGNHSAVDRRTGREGYGAGIVEASASGVPQIFVEDDPVGDCRFQRLVYSDFRGFSPDGQVVVADCRRKNKGFEQFTPADGMAEGDMQGACGKSAGRMPGFRRDYAEWSGVCGAAGWRTVGCAAPCDAPQQKSQKEGYEVPVVFQRFSPLSRLPLLGLYLSLKIRKLKTNVVL